MLLSLIPACDKGPGFKQILLRQLLYFMNVSEMPKIKMEMFFMQCESISLGHSSLICL